MKKLALVSLCLLALATPVLAAPKASVKVTNKSKWDIHHMYLSSTDNESWGPDQLGDEVIEAGGGAFTLTNIPCDTYDVKVVDEDGDECIIEAVEMCGDHSVWKITDDDLLECEGYGD